MHTAAVTVLSWAVIAAAFCAPNAYAFAAPVLLALLVAFVGLPHGAADHRVAEPALRPLFGAAWPIVFQAGYLFVAALVVVAWVLQPAVTIVAFFLVSAWHFGQEERRPNVGPRVLRSALLFARGGLVIWVPVAFRNAEVTEILSQVTPVEAAAAVATAMPWLQRLSWCMLALATAAWGLQSLRAVASHGMRRRALLADCVMVASFVGLFAAVNVLVAFIVYFCAWHSARGLKHLRIELGETWARLASTLAPATLGAIALIAVAGWLAGPTGDVAETLVRSTFLGLSAVAVPHILLHAALPTLRRWTPGEAPLAAAVGGAA